MLAAKLGVAVQTVGRWESYDPPRGLTLERLAVFAEQQRYSGATDFRYLMEAWSTAFSGPSGSESLPKKESHITLAVLEVLRRPQWAYLLPRLRRDLKPVLDAWARSFADQRRLIEAISDPIPDPKKRKKKP